MKHKKFPTKVYAFRDNTEEQTLLIEETIPELDHGDEVAIYELVDTGKIEKDLRIKLKGDTHRNIRKKSQ